MTPRDAIKDRRETDPDRCECWHDVEECVCPPDSDFDSLDTGAESPNESTQTDGAFRRYQNEYGQLKQGTKVWCNGYDGVIVRHYDGATYEIRVPGGVVATDDFELTDARLLTVSEIAERKGWTKPHNSIGQRIAAQHKSQ